MFRDRRIEAVTETQNSRFAGTVRPLSQKRFFQKIEVAPLSRQTLKIQLEKLATFWTPALMMFEDRRIKAVTEN